METTLKIRKGRIYIPMIAGFPEEGEVHAFFFKNSVLLVKPGLSTDDILTEVTQLVEEVKLWRK